MSQLITLKNLLIEGSFSLVVLGMTSKQVRLLLGVATLEYNYEPYQPGRLVWVYGNIEFSLSHQVLDRISWQPNLCTFEPCLPDAELIPLDPWIIWNGLTLMEAQSELSCNAIDFRKVSIPSRLTMEGDGVVELITSCNTRLIFRGYLNWHLEAFRSSRHIQIDTSEETFYDLYMY